MAGRRNWKSDYVQRNCVEPMRDAKNKAMRKQDWFAYMGYSAAEKNCARLREMMKRKN